MSTSTSCRSCRGGCDRSPVSTPRDHFGRRARTTHCGNASTRSSPTAASICGGGRVTALLQARVLGYVFNPLSLYWCHDADGVLRHVVAEVHNTYGGRHAYLLPPDDEPARDGDEEALRVTVQRRRRLLPGAGTATGIRTRRDDFAAPGEPTRIRRDHARRPAAGQHRPDRSTAADGTGGTADGALGIRVQGITLWLRRVPLVPRPEVAEKERVEQL